MKTLQTLATSLFILVLCSCRNGANYELVKKLDSFDTGNFHYRVTVGMNSDYTDAYGRATIRLRFEDYDGESTIDNTDYHVLKFELDFLEIELPNNRAMIDTYINMNELGISLSSGSKEIWRQLFSYSQLMGEEELGEEKLTKLKNYEAFIVITKDEMSELNENLEGSNELEIEINSLFSVIYSEKL